MGWRVLVVGNGAREHALLWKLSQSARVGALYCAPGNGGTGQLATNVPIAATNVETLADWAQSERVDLVVVGPEDPLAAGLADRLTAMGIPTFGPSAAAARIEASKSWAKQLMAEERIPTARAATFVSTVDAWEYARRQRYPLVVKADGLAAGKGVVVARTPDEARAAIGDAVDKRIFGNAGERVVVEEFLDGDEISLLALVDGARVVPLMPARDHKRVGDGDTGPNTGGMGAYAPTRLVSAEQVDRIVDQIVRPVARALVSAGTPYRGVLYAGLILTVDGPKVIEFNCRFGDPETQVVLPLLDADLADLAMAVATGSLTEEALPSASGAYCGVVVAAPGYPTKTEIGQTIDGLGDVDSDALVFHAGTRDDDGRLVTSGGRVLTVVAHGDTLAVARARAYANVERIHFPGMYYRRDIASREA